MPEPRSWFALLHTPGPAVLAGHSVFEHPDIGKHYAFLQRLAASGSLIAAGPLTDSEGDGLTVIAAPSLAAAKQLAEREDPSVLAGVLNVTVRPWQVMLAPVADHETT